MKNKLLIALFLGFWCIGAIMMSQYARAAGPARADDATTRTRQNHFIVPALTDSAAAKDISNSLPKQYDGKIKSCTYDATTTSLLIMYDPSFPEIEILQVLRMNGYEAHYFVDGNTRISLDASGTSTVSEQVKQ
ncbi:MAG: hypothetical protein FD123_2602 [Bacteroidetes bacterium]|nr:MAG: hypothetical protein FD123_2602 [Bacteroidota bacterium]